MGILIDKVQKYVYVIRKSNIMLTWIYSIVFGI